MSYWLQHVALRGNLDIDGAPFPPEFGVTPSLPHACLMRYTDWNNSFPCDIISLNAGDTWCAMGHDGDFRD